MLGKMVRGERSFKRKHIFLLSSLFKQSKKELLTMWIANKILDTVISEKINK